MRAGATLDLLFTDLPLPERIRAAASAGFAEVEILRPYGADLRALRRALDETGLGMALVNTPFGEGADAIGHAALPGASATFRRNFRAAVGAARALRARQIHVLCGRARGREADLAFVHNLAWAAALAPDLIPARETPDSLRAFRSL
jgi:hydroxypyruvate isomerase